MHATTSKTKSWIYQKRKEKKENELRLTHRLSVPKALQKGPWSLLSSAYVHCQSGSEVSGEYLSFYKNMFKCFGLAEYELIPQIWVPGKRWPGHTMNVLNPWCMCVSLLSRWSSRAVSPHILPQNYIFIGTRRCMVPQKTSALWLDGSENNSFCLSSVPLMLIGTCWCAYVHPHRTKCMTVGLLTCVIIDIYVYVYIDYDCALAVLRCEV